MLEIGVFSTNNGGYQISSKYFPKYRFAGILYLCSAGQVYSGNREKYVFNTRKADIEPLSPLEVTTDCDNYDDCPSVFPSVLSAGYYFFFRIFAFKSHAPRFANSLQILLSAGRTPVRAKGRGTSGARSPRLRSTSCFVAPVLPTLGNPVQESLSWPRFYCFNYK